MRAHRSKIPSHVLAALAFLAACSEPDLPTTVGPPILPQMAVSEAPELFFSEYIEGSGNNKALEIYNGTGSAVDLAAGGYTIEMYFNGNTSAGTTIALSGVFADGDVFVLAQSSADAAILAQADQQNGSSWYNGDDLVVLRKGGVIVDAIGQLGVDPGAEWGSGLTSTQDNTLRRKSAICTGDTNPSDAFDPATEWDGYATNTFDGLGAHTADCDAEEGAPAVLGVVPADGAGSVPVDASLLVTFTEPVDVTGDWFTISCTSGPRTATVSGGPLAWTLNPDTDFALDEDCTVTILAAGVTDQDSDDPPDQPEADFIWSFHTEVPNVCGATATLIHTIQGSGDGTPLAGQIVSIEGIVVGDFEGGFSPEIRGFYVQEEDADADGDATTSEGIFVFNGSGNDVSLGDHVRVTGTAGEFQNQTQLSSVSSILSCGSGLSVTPTEVMLPVPSTSWLEQYEGMLVHLPQTLYVTEFFQLGRFGQVVVSSQDRLPQPTTVVPPGAPANAVQADNDRNRIILDDDRNNQNPDPILFARNGDPLSASNTLRGGDTVTGVTGVLTYTWAGNSASGNAFRVRPVGALGGSVPNFVPANPRPAAPSPVGGSLKVASFNVLNWFNSFAGCTNGVSGAPTDCRGASDVTELERQAAKLVAAFTGLDADIVGIIEIENDGYGPTSAIADLVDRINAVAGAGTYAFIDADAATGQTDALGTDAIKVGLLYKPAAVTPIGQTAALNTVAFVNGGDSDLRNRPVLLQAFQTPDHARVLVAANHFKSKGSACDAPDAGDGQGNCNGVRVAAAQELLAWLATDPTGTGDPDVLILGDLNAYAMEDPIRTLQNGGFQNLIATFSGPDAYSYVFDGQWGYLDHALGSSSVTPQVSGVTEWHINADEPSVLDYNTDFKSSGQIASLFAPDAFRASDHDPVLIGLDLERTYAFGGFQAPVAPAPAVNPVKAGRSIPIKFSLSGNQGLNIFWPGYPLSVPVYCQTGVPTGAPVPTETAGGSALSYDVATDTYNYVWQTRAEWAGACRALIVRFDDGSYYSARFDFR